VSLALAVGVEEVRVGEAVRGKRGEGGEEGRLGLRRDVGVHRGPPVEELDEVALGDAPCGNTNSGSPDGHMMHKTRI